MRLTTAILFRLRLKQQARHGSTLRGEEEGQDAINQTRGRFVNWTLLLNLGPEPSPREQLYERLFPRLPQFLHFPLPCAPTALSLFISFEHVKSFLSCSPGSACLPSRRSPRIKPSWSGRVFGESSMRKQPKVSSAEYVCFLLEIRTPRVGLCLARGSGPSDMEA